MHFCHTSYLRLFLFMIHQTHTIPKILMNANKYILYIYLYRIFFIHVYLYSEHHLISAHLTLYTVSHFVIHEIIFHFIDPIVNFITIKSANCLTTSIFTHRLCKECRYGVHTGQVWECWLKQSQTCLAVHEHCCVILQYWS